MNIIKKYIINPNIIILIKCCFIAMFFSIKTTIHASVLKPRSVQIAEISKPKLSQEIADHYIKSFGNTSNKIDLKEEEINKKRKIYEVRPPELGPINKTQVIFNDIFTNSELFHILEKNMKHILNEYSWDDLKIVYGTTSAPSYHLLSKVNKTYSAMGEAILASMLVTPILNIKLLKIRQQIIKKFINHVLDTQKIKSALKIFKDSENSLLSFWTKKDPMYGKDYIKYMNSYFYSKKNKNFNKSAGRLESYKRFFRDFVGIQFKFIWPAVAIGTLETIFLCSGAQKDAYSYLRRGIHPRLIPGWSLYYINKNNSNKSGSAIAIDNVTSVLYNLSYGWSIYAGISNYNEYSGVLKRLALRMSDIQNFVKSIEKISDIISKNSDLENIYAPKLVQIRKLLNTNPKTELGRLIGYMKSLPLKSWSYFFNNSGKLLSSYKLFLEHKDSFADALFEIGQLDVFISIATLLQDSESYNKDNCYTFTKFLDRSQKRKPYIKIENMWNPFLDSKIAVTNSIYMDAVNGIRNIILTGPNAGGKSTFLTGVATTILLSQVFGIGPAKEIIITPFYKISTYINISDDIAAGKSLFIAEADRAQKHIKTLTKLKENEFSFTIMDELFSGTNPYEGEAAAYSIMEYLSKYDNALNIIATHFPIVMLLEDNVPNGRFKNYKVFIKKRPEDKKILYTFKVLPGKSTQAIAIDILEQQGYDISMLKRAREIISNRERYKSNFAK